MKVCIVVTKVILFSLLNMLVVLYLSFGNLRSFSINLNHFCFGKRIVFLPLKMVYFLHVESIVKQSSLVAGLA